MCIKISQEEALTEEYYLLPRNLPLHRSSPLLRVTPYIDEEGALRVGGRLERCPRKSEDNPLLLPDHQKIIELIINQIHNTYLHLLRDLMGRILAISLEKKIYMQVVLSFPLTPVPLCFSHVDGTINKTDKSVLFKALERRVCSQPPTIVDVVIVDGFFSLHLIVDPPATFGKTARYILIKLLAMTVARNV